MKPVALVLLAALTGISGLFHGSPAEPASASSAARVSPLAAAEITDPALGTPDESWDLEVALMGYSRGGLPPVARPSGQYDPNELLRELCEDPASSFCQQLLVSTQPATANAAMLEDEYELQRAALVPQCPPGSSFVEGLGHYGASVGVKLTGKCVDTSTKDPVAPLSPLDESESESHASENPKPITPAPSDPAPQAEVWEEVNDFDSQEGCLVTVGETRYGDTETLQNCPASVTPVNEAAETDTPVNDSPVVVISAAPETPSTLELCVMGHPEEVTGEHARCTPGDTVQGQGTVPPAVILAPLTHLLLDDSAPASSSSGAATDAVPLAVNAHVFVNGGWILESGVDHDGQVTLELPGLPSGVHHVEFLFDPVHDELPPTAMDVLMNVPEATEDTHAPSPSTDTTSPQLLIVWGTLLGTAALLTLWLLLGERLRSAPARR